MEGDEEVAVSGRRERDVLWERKEETEEGRKRGERGEKEGRKGGERGERRRQRGAVTNKGHPSRVFFHGTRAGLCS